MSTTTITVRVKVGAQTFAVDMVGDPNDALFATQVGRTISQMLLGHRGGEGTHPEVTTGGDSTVCDMPDCIQTVSYWRKATCGCVIFVCYTHRQRQQEAGAFWCGGHETRAQWFQERYLR